MRRKRVWIGVRPMSVRVCGRFVGGVCSCRELTIRAAPGACVWYKRRCIQGVSGGYVRG